MSKSKTNHQFLQYKVAKIVRLIRKIRHTLQEEGLDPKQLPQLINHSLKIHDPCLSDGSSKSSPFQDFAIQSLTKNSNKFTVSTLMALSETYKNLLRGLDDQSSTDLKKVSSAKQTKEVKVKLEQVFPSNQSKKERSIPVKIEEENAGHNQQQAQIKAIQRELAQKRRQMKLLKAQIKLSRRQYQPTKDSSRKEKKKNRK